MDNNLSDNATLLKNQNKWVAFDNDKNIIASEKSYQALHKAIPENMSDKVEVTFINSADAFIAP